MNAFQKLPIRQRIYKIADLMRAEEIKAGLESDPALIWAELTAKARSILHDIENKRSMKAMNLILHYVDASKQQGYSVSMLRQDLNFCYHELLELIERAVKDEDYREKSVTVFDKAAPVTRFPVAAVLDNLRSPFNVGSIFRSSDCFGVSELALCGICPKPPAPKIEKTAMGTTAFVTWKYFDKTSDAIIHYREAGFAVCAVETVASSRSLYALGSFEKTAFVFGNEEFGISEENIELCDFTMSVPLVGMKNSLNVANCYSVVMSEMMRRALNL